MDSDRITKWMTAVGAITVPIIAIIVYVTDILPTAERMGRIFNNECTKMGIATETNVDESAEEIVAKLVNYRNDPRDAREEVYRDAFEQADDKGYVSLIDGLYRTSNNWKDTNRRLLTVKEREVIRECFFNHTEQELYDLMYTILTDEGMTGELGRLCAYDVEICKPIKVLGEGAQNVAGSGKMEREKIGNSVVVSEKIVLHLTPYDKIGIIGGYVGDLTLIHGR